MSTVYADPAILWDRALMKVWVPANGCWIFTGAVNSKGYPCVSSGRKGSNMLAHRLAVLVRDGVLPDQPVDHLCHNADRSCPGGRDCQHRRCIRPDHLEVVTTAENNRRMWQRRRTKPRAA